MNKKKCKRIVPKYNILKKHNPLATVCIIVHRGVWIVYTNFNWFPKYNKYVFSFVGLKTLLSFIKSRVDIYILAMLFYAISTLKLDNK